MDKFFKNYGSRQNILGGHVFVRRNRVAPNVFVGQRGQRGNRVGGGRDLKKIVWGRNDIERKSLGGRTFSDE